MKICQKTYLQISSHSDCVLDITVWSLAMFYSVHTSHWISLRENFSNSLLNGAWSGFAGRGLPSCAWLQFGFFRVQIPLPDTHWTLLSLWTAYRFFRCTFGLLFGRAKCKHTSLFSFQFGANEINEIKNPQVKLLTKWAATLPLWVRANGWKTSDWIWLNSLFSFFFCALVWHMVKILMGQWPKRRELEWVGQERANSLVTLVAGVLGE